MSDKKFALEFDSNIWSSSPKVDRAVEFLKEEIKALGIRKRWHDHYDGHIKLIILNFYNAYLTAPSFSVSYWRSNNHYSEKGTKFYNATRLSYKALSAMVDAMNENHLGYLSTLKGYRIRGNEKKAQISRMKAMPKLIDLLIYRFEFKPKVLERHPDEKLIILKDKFKEKVRLDGGKYKTIIVTKKIEYEETAEVVHMRHNLRTINETLARHFIGLCTNDESITQLRERLLNNKDDDGDDYLKVIDYSKLKLRRIFNNGTFDNGGRFYGGWWQALPSKEGPLEEYDDDIYPLEEVQREGPLKGLIEVHIAEPAKKVQNPEYTGHQIRN